MEFTDFTQLSPLESLIQLFSGKSHLEFDHLLFEFSKREYVVELTHQRPSVMLNMFESIGHDGSCLESRVARIFKIDEFYTIRPVDLSETISEELLRTIISTLILAGNFRGSIFGSLESDKILGVAIEGKGISRLYTFKPSENFEASTDYRLMRLIDISIPAVKVTSHLRKLILEQNKKVHWFPWTTKENPIQKFRLQFLWPSTIGVDPEVSVYLLETAPIWFLSYSSANKMEDDKSFTDLQNFIKDFRNNDDLIRNVASAVTEADKIWSTNAVLDLFGHQENFIEHLAKILGLCMAYSSDAKDCALLASFWGKFVEHLRSSFRELQPIFSSSPEKNFDIRANLIHQKLVLLDYSIKKELQYQAIHSRPSPSRAKNIQSRDFSHTTTEKFCDSSQTKNTRLNSATNENGRLCRLSDEMLLNHPDIPIWVPVSQDPGFISADIVALYESTLMDESVNNEIKTRLRSEQLISDMRAFKAVNNLAEFEDFIRWYSPKDWNSSERTLSKRMAEENNLWRTLWNSSDPVLACDQEQIFDPFLEGERCLHFFDEMSVKNISDLISEYLAGNFEKQLKNISTQMKLPEISTSNLDEMAHILCIHYFTSLEFPKISDILRRGIIQEKLGQIIVCEDEDRSIIIQRLNETDWTLERDELFISDSPTTYVLKILGKSDYVGKIITFQ